MVNVRLQVTQLNQIRLATGHYISVRRVIIAYISLSFLSTCVKSLRSSEAAELPGERSESVEHLLLLQLGI
jgi:hypothetical protein